MVTAAVVLIGWSPGLTACPKLFLERVVGYSSLWGTWGISRLLFLTDSPSFNAIGYGAPSTIGKAIASGLKLSVVLAALALAWRRRKLPDEGLIGTVAATWAVFFVLAPAGAAQYMIWPLVPFFLYSPRLGLIYLIAAMPFMFLFYMTAAPSPLDLLYPTLCAWCPLLGGENGWTWPALFLWLVLLVILVRELPRWWSLLTPEPAGRECDSRGEGQHEGPETDAKPNLEQLPQSV